ncbi:MAG: O-antigen ligase family protein [Candidatus Zixiibacteriota bacterium]
MIATDGIGKRPRLAVLTAINGFAIGVSIFVGPLGAVLAIGGTALLLIGLVSEIGFVAVTTLISHFSDDMGTSFDLIRGLKWGLMAFVLTVTVWRFAMRKDWSGLKIGFMEKYFAVFFFWGIICLFFSDNPQASVFEFLRVLALYLIYFIARETIRDRRHVYIVIGLFTLVVFSSSLYSVASLLQGHYFRLRGFMNNSGEYAQALTFMLPFLIAAAVLTKSKILRYFMIAVTTLGVIVVFLAWSRGVIIGMFIQAIVMLLVHRRYKVIAGMGAAAIAIAIALFLIPSVFDIFYKVGRLQAGTTHRTTLWKAGIESIVDSPIFGQGFEVRVSDVLHRVHWNDLSAATMFKDASGRFHPHNHYIRAAVSTGIPGLLIFLGFLYFLIKGGIRDCITERGRRRAVLFSGLLGIYVSFVFHSMFTTAPLFGSGSYANYFWIGLGLVHAIKNRDIDI